MRACMLIVLAFPFATYLIKLFGCHLMLAKYAP